ncbi:nose resistant to fluoxetine protein 6 [Trichonephila inaurata madagascariensis]|uniref:Nose resistant to fluoxetine protein 6 n=1 Tax=Trichonephila inaurata madagascariensis TaxID=2747483 RepID=A0A8X6X2F0_9ARAC|nr:nose resistant to fluoxetine protein 6 [Trichonephila inaurata madagascariensis]
MINIFYTGNILSIPELSSDHKPVKITSPASTKFSLPSPQTYKNWNIFKNGENYDTTTANSPDDVDAKIHNITEQLQLAHKLDSNPVNQSGKPFVPLYAIVLGLYAVLFSYMGSGPVWPTYSTNSVCKESWWWNLFFINNFQNIWEQCYVPAWYLAADMQLLLISPLFLISLFKTWIYVDIIYIKPVSNLSAYLIGLGLGHYLWKREICKKGRNNMIILCCGWIGFTISMWICFNVLYFSKETLLKRVVFNGFSDFFFSCGIAWIIYVCATKQGGV